jgi:hypothetical protein
VVAHGLWYISVVSGGPAASWCMITYSRFGRTCCLLVYDNIVVSGGPTASWCITYSRFGRTCCLHFQSRRKIISCYSLFGKTTKNYQHSSYTNTGRYVICYLGILPVPMTARSKAYACGRSPAEIVGSNPTDGMDVCCECCVLSGRGLCDELATRPEESYRLWRVAVCGIETSSMRSHNISSL